MIMVLRIVIILLGIGFLLPGFSGAFRTERLADALALTPDSPVGLTSIAVLIGAPYLAMGLMAIYAAARKQWSWLAPLAVIEGMMVIIRVKTGFTLGFEAAGVRFIIMEIIACTVLGLGAMMAARPENN